MEKKKPRYQRISGVNVPLPFIPDVFHSAMEYRPKKNEVIVSSYPKCGATWVSHIVLLILRGGRPCSDADEYFASVPFLEIVGSEGLKYAAKPYCIKTHLPFYRMNLSQEANYIYVLRNPWDCVVSLYHHVKFFSTYFFSDGSFDDFLELFIKGEVDYNNYFDHFHESYSNKFCCNFLFITYEAIEANLKDTVLRIAQFLAEENYRNLTSSGEKVLRDILFCCSSDYMRYTVNEYSREMFIDKPLTGNSQSVLPIFGKFSQILKEAEADGHYSNGESDREKDNEIVFSDDHIKKLNWFIAFHVWEERYDFISYLQKKENRFLST